MTRCRSPLSRIGLIANDEILIVRITNNDILSSDITYFSSLLDIRTQNLVPSLTLQVAGHTVRWL